jgi:arginyl-tRNA synthetase
MSVTHPVARLADDLAAAAGSPVELERPGDAAHGDYATNVALRLAPSRGRAPRELAAEIAAGAVDSGVVERA